MKKAPDFSLPDQDGVTHRLSSYKGKKVLLYFYPKDNTPGCTTEACNFRDKIARLKSHDLVILGISPDSAASHKKFSQNLNLPFPLLADSEKVTAKAYGVWVEKSMYGKKYMGIQRDSFLIDEQGRIIKQYVKVNPKTHVEDVLNDLKTIE